MLSPRFLSPFTQARYFTRALGFELFNTLFRRWAANESPKPVLRRSRWIALSRCTIHILPCVIFLFLIPLNFSAMYLGPGFSYRESNGLFLVLFQIAAKMLEIVCVASLTTVVLHVLRHDLLRDGVPLSFVGSGIFFSQANCFWSPEMFVGALHCVRSWKRLRLLMVIVVAGLLALLIAPSAAVLIQARSQSVPAGGTAYYLPVTPDQLWPSEVDGSDERSECFEEFAVQNILCPSAGSESLRSYFQNFNSSFYVPSMLKATYGLAPVVVQSLAGKVPRLLSVGALRGWARESSVYQPNAITAILQDELTGDWRNATKNWSGSRFSAAREYSYADQRLSSVWTTSAQVLPRCAAAQNVSAGQFEINFPVKYWTTRVKFNSSGESSQWSDDTKPINITIADHNMSNNIQSEWVPLPVDVFGPVSGGVLLHFPRQASNSSRAVIACSIGASWFFGEITSDSLSNEAAWSFTDGRLLLAQHRSDLNASSAEAHRYRRLITIHDKWFRSLTPRMPCENCQNRSEAPNILENIFSDTGLSIVLDDMRMYPQFRWNKSTKQCVLQPFDPSDTDVDRLNSADCGLGGKYQLIELILGSVFANGLSRYGSHHAFEPSTTVTGNNPFQWELKTPPKAPDYYTSLLSNRPHKNAVLPAPADSGYVKLRMRMQVVGYAWYASGFSDYLATVVVIIYMLVALTHTVWILRTGVTSSSWDTVTELLALALQSPVPEALRGSGAGIERLGSYRRMVRLRTAKDGAECAEAGTERLVLVVNKECCNKKAAQAPEQARRFSYKQVEVDEEYL